MQTKLIHLFEVDKKNAKYFYILSNKVRKSADSKDSTQIPDIPSCKITNFSTDRVNIVFLIVISPAKTTFIQVSFSIFNNNRSYIVV